MVELVYKSMRSLPRVFEMVSQSLKYHSNFFVGHIHIYYTGQDEI